MDIKTIVDILVGLGSVLGTISFFKSIRKPKAELQFADGKKEITFSPHYCRTVSTKYYVGPINDGYDASAYQSLVEKYNQKLEAESEFVLSFQLKNTGKLQLENYRVEIQFKEGIHKIGVIAYKPFVLQELMEYTETLDGVSLKDNKHKIVYGAPDQLPLNQKDSKEFAVRFSPHPDAEKIELLWRISAKDFSKEGKLLVHLTPTVDELDDIHFKNCNRDVPEGGYLIEDLMPYIKKMQKLVFDNK